MNLLEIIGFTTVCCFSIVGLFYLSENIIDYFSRKFNFYFTVVEYARYRKEFKKWYKKAVKQDL